MQSSSIHGQFIQKLSELSSLSDQVYQYYFADTTRRDIRKPFFKLKKNVIELYTFVYEFSTSKPNYEQKLFQLFKTALQQHLLKHMPILNQSIGQHNLIVVFNLIWDSYTAYLFLLSKRIFSYLNRFFIPANDYESLQKVGIKQFTRIFLTESTLRAFFGAYCHDLNQIRNSRIICDNQLYHFSQSLALIINSNYFSILKDIYCNESSKFYEKIYDQNCNIEPINYLNLINNLWYFQQTVQQKSICLLQAEAKQILQNFSSKLIKSYTQKFVKHPYGFRYFLKSHKINELKIVYRVYSKCEGFDELRKQLYQFIIQQGFIKLNQKSINSKPQDFIQSFFDYYIAYSKLITQGFSRNQEMQVSLQNSIQKLASRFDNMAQLLFDFTRQLLDHGKFERHRETIITIFQQLTYKDEYLSMYRNSLQKRIINGQVIYMIEKDFIQTMNKICGSQTTNQLDKILQDYIESMPNQIIPQNLKQQNFEIKILGLHYWQKKFKNQSAMNLTLFSSLNDSWNNFQSAYISKFPKRKLIILPYETKLIIQMQYKKLSLKIKCNLIQACILLKVAEKQTNIIRQQDLIMGLTLQKSFLLPTLAEIPNLMIQIEPGLYKLNWEFKHDGNLIDISSRIQQQNKFTKNINEDRQILIQAAIVKIAKAQKQIMFEILVRELEKRIKLFKPHPQNIKQAVQKLIKRDMIEQVAGGSIRYLE